jgi:glycosyltransferase involved in cell wall biosynthesis
MKSIMLATWFFYPFRTGGLESIALKQALYFVNIGYRVSVVTSRVDNAPVFENYRGIEIYRKEFMDSKTEYSIDRLGVEFSELLDIIKPDIVHFHNGSYPSGTKDRSIGVAKITKMFKLIKERGIKAIDHAHNAQLADKEITKALRELPWDFVICVSKFVETKWREFGTGAKEIKVVYNGIDLESFKNISPAKEMTDLKKNGETIIFFPARVIRVSNGEIGKQKNFLMVAEACRRLKEREIDNFKLVVIFDLDSQDEAARASKQKLDNLFNTYNLYENVAYLKPIDALKMPEYYAGTDITCVPSYFETFGLVYLETMAAGKVAIASNTGGPCEIIEDKKDGFLVNPDDASELVVVLKTLLDNKEIIEQIGDRAKFKARQFSFNQMMRGIEEVYEELLCQK